MKKARIVLSETARMHLAAAGIGTGWLKVWLLSAGAEQVSIHALEPDSRTDIQGWQLYIGTESELFRLALAHGKKICVRDRGQRDLIGVQSVNLVNPCRHAWYYDQGSKKDLVMLLPIGDLAYQREKWLSVFRENRMLLPAQVWAGGEGGIELEPGLRGDVLRSQSVRGGTLLNDGGYLPEEQLLFLLNRYGWRLRLAESCTGGGISERMSRIPGASEVLDCAWITYSNDAKHSLLKVSRRLLAKHGAVSQEVAEAMADRGRDKRHACVSITGIAGPGGGSEEKPVGTVWVAVATPDGGMSSRYLTLSGSRSEVQSCSIVAGMSLLISLLAVQATAE